MESNLKLKSYIERIEKIEEEKKALADDISSIYAEAKAIGFDTKIIRKVIALRKKSEEDRKEEAALIDLYMKELGMLADTPLGKAAIDAKLKEDPAWKALK